MYEWKRQAAVRSQVLAALDTQPTLGDFLQAVEVATGYPAELRGANPVLDRSLSDERTVRLNRLGLRRQFWLRLVTGWQDDFAQLAEEQGSALVSHLWRGLMGRLLAQEERPLVREFAKQAGVVEVAQALCAVVADNPEATPTDVIFAQLSERCRAVIAERQKQGLPAPVLKRHLAIRSTGSDMGERFLQALSAYGSQWPRTQAEFDRTVLGQVSEASSRPTKTKSLAASKRTSAQRLRVTGYGIVPFGADPE